MPGEDESKSVLTRLSRSKCHNGVVDKYKHDSSSLKCEMKFSVFQPAKALEGNKCSVLYFLSGLTCTEDNFIQKANAVAAASNHELILVCPDTSPRGKDVPDDTEDWSFGQGAGFYLNATQEPYNQHYHMYTYITEELLNLVNAEFSTTGAQSVFGHSMGGHGALICYLKNPNLYASVSAFAPICNPSEVPWGVNAFSKYLGADNKEDWKQYDAFHLLTEFKGFRDQKILIDQGLDDQFLPQLKYEEFSVQATDGQDEDKEYTALAIRTHEGYDHSYWFIQTFINDHLNHHATYLKASAHSFSDSLDD